MRILLINKFLYPKGGADRHVLALKDLFEARGHTVILFGMEHPENPPASKSPYNVSFVDFERVRFDWQGLRAAARMFYSFEARRKLQQLIKAERPDIAHIHNIYHQISPSILGVLKRHGIPVVQTIHDAKRVSPNYNLYAHGGICNHGLGGGYFACVRHRCMKGSFFASLLAACEMYFQRWRKVYENGVDVVLSPSKFFLDLMQHYSPASRDVRYLPNFVTLAQETATTIGSYALYVGRLSEEKGVLDLVTAARKTTMPIRIVGDGPLRMQLQAVIDREHLAHVRLLGFQHGDSLTRLYREARCVVVPSRCYENAPLTILEAYAYGKPVIAPRHGGAMESVRDGVTGYLFTPGSTEDLARALNRCAQDDDATLAAAGESGRALLAEASPEHYATTIIALYEELLSHRRA